MLKTSHLQELKRRYLGIYVPEPEEIDEHCGVCGEGEGIEEGKKSAEYSGYDAIALKPGKPLKIVDVHSHPFPTRS